MFLAVMRARDTDVTPTEKGLGAQAIKRFYKIFNNKNMITVLEVALLIAIIIVPLVPQKSAKVK